MREVESVRGHKTLRVREPPHLSHTYLRAGCACVAWGHPQGVQRLGVPRHRDWPQRRAARRTARLEPQQAGPRGQHRLVVALDGAAAARQRRPALAAGLAEAVHEARSDEGDRIAEQEDEPHLWGDRGRYGYGGDVRQPALMMEGTLGNSRRMRKGTCRSMPLATRLRLCCDRA